MSGYVTPGSGDPERSARIATAVLGVLGLIGVLIAALAISDHAPSGSTLGPGAAQTGAGGAVGVVPAGGNPSSGGHLTGAAGRAYLLAHFPYPADATLPPPTAAQAPDDESYRVTHLSLGAAKAFYAAALPRIGATLEADPEIVQNGVVMSYACQIGTDDGDSLADMDLVENLYGKSPGLVTIDVDTD